MNAVYRVHLTYPSGSVETRVFPSALLRSLFVIGLQGRVVVQVDEPTVTS